jgi:hypothetical protein
MVLQIQVDVTKRLVSLKNTISGQQGALKKIIFLKTLEFKSFKNTQLYGDQLTDGRTNGRTNGDQPMDGWTNEPTDQRTNGQTDEPA